MPPINFPLNVTVSEAADLVKSGAHSARVLDVREPNELALCQVEGAECIPMGEIPGRVATLSRDQHFLVLCHHGSRSLRVTQFLRQQGFTAVSNIAGGIDAWALEVDPTLARY
ncbi:MAG: moeZ 1 [Verrucomicrobia bacterium]|nr:moeZ 1 [Verrucomicrobiota bacterium]